MNAPHKEIAWIDAHGGNTADWQCSRNYVRATGSMDGWSTHLGLGLRDDRPASLSKHIQHDNGHLQILGIALAAEHRKDKTTPIRWESTLKVSDGRYVRAHGFAPDFHTAVQAATSYQHESRQIGSLTWWLESDGGWISWLGGMTMRASLITARTNESAYWHFETSGDAPTFEEAALLASMRNA